MSESTLPVARPIAKHAAPRRRRRWPWLVLVLVVAMLLGLAVAGLLYASTVVGDEASATTRRVGFPLTVTTADGAALSYTTPEPGDGLPTDQGLMGLVSIFGGYAQSDSPLSTGGSTARQVMSTVIGPPLAQDQPVTLDPWFFPRNPQVGLGLGYEEVTYDGPLGPTPAWLIPGESSTWVVYVHGLGTTPLEGLRIAQTANASGHPVLLIRYRGDALAPKSDGFATFGAGEWPDLEAAVQYALDHGAQKVVLAATGMGGSIALAFLENSALAPRVTGAFLDSPITDARPTVEARAVERGVPTWATGAASTIASWRFGLDWNSTDYTSVAAALTTPTLIVQGSADEQVPPATVQSFVAAADPSIVSLQMVDGAGYGMAWNLDRSGYERRLSGFLASVA